MLLFVPIKPTCGKSLVTCFLFQSFLCFFYFFGLPFVDGTGRKRGMKTELAYAYGAQQLGPSFCHGPLVVCHVEIVTLPSFLLFFWKDIKGRRNSTTYVNNHFTSNLAANYQFFFFFFWVKSANYQSITRFYVFHYLYHFFYFKKIYITNFFLSQL